MYKRAAKKEPLALQLFPVQYETQKTCLRPDEDWHCYCRMFLSSIRPRICDLY